MYGTFPSDLNLLKKLSNLVLGCYLVTRGPVLSSYLEDRVSRSGAP